MYTQRPYTEASEWVADAAQRTLDIMTASGFIPYTFKDDPVGGQHIEEMLAKLVSGEITGRKAHRWLGWVQAVVCGKAGVSLDVLTRINKAASDAAPTPLSAIATTEKK